MDSNAITLVNLSKKLPNTKEKAINLLLSFFNH